MPRKPKHKPKTTITLLKCPICGKPCIIKQTKTKPIAYCPKHKKIGL